MSAPRLVLVRHGRPAHAGRGWYDAAGVRGWLAAYDASGLADGERPPAELVALAAAAPIVAASDLPRARESAARLAPDAPVIECPLLRETPPPFPALGPVRLPLAAWALAVGVGQAYRAACGEPAPPAARRQAADAAAWLARLGEQHGLVVAVTHASVRGHIARALAARGWARDPGPRGLGGRYAHWSAWSFAPARRAAAAVPAAVTVRGPAARAAARGRAGAGHAPSTSTPTS
jgi:broad specificity phosphatase PhoE